MGAGITKKQDRDRKRWALKTMERELLKAGVACRYDNMQVTGTGFRVHFGETVRASNGEAWGNCVVEVGVIEPLKTDWEYEVGNGDTELGWKEWCAHQIEANAPDVEVYTFMEYNSGLARIKALHGNPEHRARLHETELAWLICKIERAAKRDGPVFLLTPEGKLFDSGEERNKYAIDPATGLFPDAMYEGQLYCYNEMQNGKPMLRVRQGGGPENYIEFLSGWKVVDKDGKVIAERKA